MHITAADERYQWQWLLGALAGMLFLWSISFIPDALAIAQPVPDIGDAVTRFAETYDLDSTERQALTKTVADWLARNPQLEERPLHVYQLMQQHWKVPQ